MDQFIKVTKYKNYNIFGRDEIVKDILKCIENKSILCLHGNSGVGKSFLIREILKNFSFNDICHDILKSKNDTIIFLEKIKYSYSHLLIDDIDTEFNGWKEIVELIKSKKLILKGSMIIILRTIEKIDFCNTIYVPSLALPDIIKLGRDKYPKFSHDEIEILAKKSKGNLRNFFYSFEFPDERDVFFTPKETIHNLICSSEIKPSDYICKTVEDHGYSWGVIHENYLLSSYISLEDVVKISDHMSMSDVYDNRLYNREWDLCKFFCHEAIIIPSIILNQKLCRETLKPGSSWTKYNNYMMRKGKLKEMSDRQGNFTTDIDLLMLIRDYCQVEKIGFVKFLIKNKFKSQDLDVINHIALLNKIKPKLLNNIKKELKKYEVSK